MTIRTSLIATLLFMSVGCKTTYVTGVVVSCADRKPIDQALITFVEASPDPSKPKVSGNYYYDTTKPDGTFKTGGYGDPSTTYWTAEASKAGFQKNAVRYE